VDVGQLVDENGDLPAWRERRCEDDDVVTVVDVPLGSPRHDVVPLHPIAGGPPAASSKCRSR